MFGSSVVSCVLYSYSLKHLLCSIYFANRWRCKCAVCTLPRKHVQMGKFQNSRFPEKMATLNVDSRHPRPDWDKISTIHKYLPMPVFGEDQLWDFNIKMGKILGYFSKWVLCGSCYKILLRIKTILYDTDNHKTYLNESSNLAKH